METILIYLIKSAVSIAILTIAYRVLFSALASFKLNRLILLTIVMFGFTGIAIVNTALPAIFRFNTIVPKELPDGLLISNLSEITISAASTLNRFAFVNLLFTGYIIVTIFMGFRFTFNLFKLWNLHYRSEKIEANGYKIVLTEKNIQTFSFFNNLFINKALYHSEQGLRQIIKHELAHINQKHSIDIVLAELLIIFQWFNPFVYLLKKSISETHEYLADRRTLATEPDISGYKLLVLTHSTSQRVNSITNNFSYLLIKKRISMMEKTVSKFKTGITVLVFTMVLAGVTISCSDMPGKSEPAAQPKQTTRLSDSLAAEKPPVPETISPKKQDSIYAVVENMPEFPGGRKAFMKYLADNIKYPKQAKKKGIHGRVFVNFTVEEDGSITNAKLLRGIGGGCDEESIRVVEAMPKWIPGEHEGKKVRVSFNVPIKFVLN